MISSISLVDGMELVIALIVCRLAHAEMYLTFARVIRNFDMELRNMTANDVLINTVLIMGQPKIDKNRIPGQGEVEVIITRKLEC